MPKKNISASINIEVAELLDLLPGRVKLPSKSEVVEKSILAFTLAHAPELYRQYKDGCLEPGRELPSKEILDL